MFGLQKGVWTSPVPEGTLDNPFKRTIIQMYGTWMLQIL